MSAWVRLAVLLLTVGLPFTAQAQEEAPASTPRGDRPAAAPIDEVERGPYFGVLAGPSFLFNPPAAEGTSRPFSPGQMAQVEVGFDLGERLSLGVFLSGAYHRAGADYVGFSGGSASGDFSSLVPGAVLRLHALGFADDQGVRRTWLYLRGGAGYAMFWPRALLPDAEVLVFAGPGVEYFTKLRHFSVGLEVTGTYLLTSKAAGFAVTPTLRYAF